LTLKLAVMIMEYSPKLMYAGSFERDYNEEKRICVWEK